MKIFEFENTKEIEASGVKELIRGEGIDLVGIADAQNFIITGGPMATTISGLASAWHSSLSGSVTSPLRP